MTAVSMLILACALGALSYALIDVWTTDGGPEASIPAAPTPTRVGAAEQSILPTPSPSATPLPTQTSTPTQPPTSTPQPTSTATSEPTSIATLEPTETPTLEPTDTSTPEPTETPTREPTNTPAPTATPRPALPLVPDPDFRADRTTIAGGECTVLHWDVDGVQAVFLDGAGRPGHSSEVVCPERTHTYALRVVMPSGQAKSYPLQVVVVGYAPLVLNIFTQDSSCDTQEAYAAKISVWAQGGDGWYTYYRDDLSQWIGGPTMGGVVYKLSWRTCGIAPGTFIVRSGDGQEARQHFAVEPPDCCGEPR